MFKLNYWPEFSTENIKEADICLMGIPFDGATSCGKGASFAPEMIRRLSVYLDPITEEGRIFDSLKIYDHGDIDTDLDWPRYFKKVEEEALQLFKTGAFCLFLGGDHSVTIPLHKAFGHYNKGKKIGIIHFDSHLDIYDEYEGSKWSHACTERRALDDVIKGENLAFVGIRSWGYDEVEYCEDHKEIEIIKAVDIHKNGYQTACHRLEEKFRGYDSIYLTLDIDVLDPSCGPGTGTPEAGGLETRELMEMVKFLVEKVPIKAMDLVEVAPPLDTKHNITSWAALKVIYEVFGKLAKR